MRSSKGERSCRASIYLELEVPHNHMSVLGKLMLFQLSMFRSRPHQLDYRLTHHLVSTTVGQPQARLPHIRLAPFYAQLTLRVSPSHLPDPSHATHLVA